MESFEIDAILSIARDILSERLGVLKGSSELQSRIVEALNIADGITPEYAVFATASTASAHLPMGPERRHWNVDALKSKDIEIAMLTECHRERVLAACRSLIKRFGDS